jgi:hypothetical protein
LVAIRPKVLNQDSQNQQKPPIHEGKRILVLLIISIFRHSEKHLVFQMAGIKHSYNISEMILETHNKIFFLPEYK